MIDERKSVEETQPLLFCQIKNFTNVKFAKKTWPFMRGKRY